MAENIANKVATLLNGAIDNDDTSLVVDSATGFPEADFRLVIQDGETDDTNREIVKVTAKSGTTLTVVRAQEGTTGVSHGDNSYVVHALTAATLNSLVRGPNLLIGNPPAFVTSTADKDFRSATSLSPYTAVGTSSGTVNLLQTTSSTNLYQLTAAGLLVQLGTGQTASFRADYSLPDGRSIIATLASPRHTLGDNSQVALVLNDNDTSDTSGNWTRLMLEQDSTEWIVQASSSTDSTGQEMSQQEVELPHLLLFRIARNGLVYSTWVSMDGGAWSYLGFQQTAGGAYTNVWIMATTNTMQTYAPAILFPFIVEGANTYLPWGT